MAGTAKNYSPNQIWQAPGDMWIIGTPPTGIGASVRLTLASDGSPDATAHPGSIHLGYMAGAIVTSLKPKIAPITLDQADAPVDGFVEDLASVIEPEIAQTTSELLAAFLPVGTYAAASPGDQLTFGGNLAVATPCFACISPNRASAGNFRVAMLYQAVSTGGFKISLGRKKPSSYKAKLQGLANLAAAVGQQQGVIYDTLTPPVGGTPTTRHYDTSTIRQGAADLWLIAPAPADANPIVALDPTTLTPVAATYGQAWNFGLTNGAVDLDVTPKISFFTCDQADAPVGAFIEELACKISTELKQSSMAAFLAAMGVGVETLSGGAYDELTFGGNNQPAEVCIAAIAVDRTDTTKAIQFGLYKTFGAGGVSWTVTRKKTSDYKVEWTGLADLTRTAGRQIGWYAEMTSAPGEY